MAIKLWNASQLAVYPNNPYAVGLQLDTLLPLITSKTRIVAFTACSNILGSIVPVAEIVKAVRARGAELGVRKLEVCVDCVAYAPHRQVDVRAWDVDYAYFSFYKVRFYSVSLPSSASLSPHHDLTRLALLAHAGLRSAHLCPIRPPRFPRLLTLLTWAPLPPRARQAVQDTAGRAWLRIAVGVHARHTVSQVTHAQWYARRRVARGHAA